MPVSFPAIAGSLKNPAFLLASALLLGGCGTGGTDPTHPPAATAKAAAPALTQLSMYLDASTGMRGFMHPNAPGEPGSDFQRTVAELLSNLHDQTAARQAYYFVQESTPKDPRVLRPSSYDELSSTVSTGIKTPALGTEMPTMLREVLRGQQSQPGAVSIIISDFIYAPPDLTQTWRVKTDVKDALSTAPAADLALSVFAGTSAFRDKFFPGNRSRPQVLSGSRVPYYVWVLGRPAAVAAALPLLRPLLGAGFERLSYNLPAPPAVVFEHFGNQGTWYVSKSGNAQTQPLTLNFSERPTRQQPAEAVLGLDLSAAPATEAAELPQTLRLDDGGTGATLAKVQKTSAVAHPPSSAALPAYTHLATLRLERLPGAAATLRLVLPRPGLPAWVATYSTTNDSNLAKQGPKTFLLSELLQGVQDYYAAQPAGREVWALPVQVVAK